MDSTEEATPMQSLLTIPTEDLLEARDRVDAGNRLALPMLLDRTEVFPIEDAPVTKVETKDLDPELIEDVLGDVAEMHHRLYRNLKHLDKHSPRSLHVSVGRAVLALQEVLEDAVAQEWRRS